MEQRQEVLRFEPNNPDDAYYWERVDRNIGWITREEQAKLRCSVIGIAGCGGMGGQLAEKFLRLGIGELRIADSEAFDASNINRQFAATRFSLGKSKACETARVLRSISDDSTLAAYPQGITEETAANFVRGCDVICDEIEFWAVGARILLHREARKARIPIFVGNTLGFGTHLFLFTPESFTMEECLELSYEEAFGIEQRFVAGDIGERELVKIMESVTRGLFPEWNGCGPTRDRLIKEKKGAIIATNPPLACGFVADHVLLHLLRQSPVRRKVTEVPPMPGYLYLDAAQMMAKIVKGKWW